MRRRLVYLGVAVALAGATGLALGLVESGPDRARASLFAGPDRGELPDPRPNIVVVETDDQTVEQMSAMQKTLHLLGDEGTTFDSSFASLSLCCPSRASFLTGEYAHNHGVISNSLPDGGYRKLDSTETLPVWLQDAGYRTAFVGKYLNGYGKRRKEIPPGWNDWHAVIDFSYFNYQMNDNGKIHGHGHRASDYQTDVFTRKATHVIDRLAPSHRPFFLWVSYFAPHAGGSGRRVSPHLVATPRPAPRYRNAFAGAKLPDSPSFNEADVSDKPPAIRNRPLLTQSSLRAIRRAYQEQLESLLSVDDGVAAIVNSLRSRGELDNTLIVFTDDNGYFHGEHRVPSGKVLLYDPSIRVPLLMRGPGVPAGMRLNQIVSNVDLAPTLLDVAEAKPRGAVPDGRSLIPLLRNPKLQWGRDLLIERLPEAAEAGRRPYRLRSTGEIGAGDGGNQGRPGTPRDRAYAAIRTPRFLYAEYANGARELYDLERDPYELTSVHDGPAYAPIVAELSRRLHRLRDCRGLSCRAGPRVTLTVPRAARRSTAASCPSRIEASLRGADEQWVKAVRFFANRKLVALVRNPPFSRNVPRALLSTSRRTPRIRARITFLDGRKADRLQLVAASCRGRPVSHRSP